MKVKAILILLLFLKLEMVSSQAPKDKYAFLLKAGNKEFASFHYKYALTFYQEYYKKNSHSFETLQLIGDCYYKMLNYDDALQIYTSLPVKSTPVLEKIAELYAWKQDYNEAKNAYYRLNSRTKSDARSSYYLERISGFDKINDFYKDSLDWKVKFLNINSAANEQSPLFFQNGLLFVSNRNTGNFQPNSYGWNGENKDHIYFLKDRSTLFEINPNSIKKVLEEKIEFLIDRTPATSNDNNTLTKKRVKYKKEYEVNSVPLFEEGLKLMANVGPLSMTGDGNVIYFTRNRSDKVNGVNLLEVCKIEKTSNKWGNVIVLSLNVPTASSFHPFINSSGTTLYFASDREGGFGGTDIYKVEKLNDTSWSNPENLGSSVNSQGNELFPSENNNELFFSSNGWGGLGGLDLFQISEQHSEKPVNLGYPINSSSDDFGFVSTLEGKEGYFSSNRYGNDDLFGYRFEKYFSSINGTIIDAKTKNIKK
jgi:tetratricopeptide (TPR) repeat protein